jgi:pimeloyl-ACP methyl ester carboxylesterase
MGMDYWLARTEKALEKLKTITLPDGRRLGYLVVGSGKPVLYIHGIPECRLEALFLKGIADSRHLRVVGVDRPGFGLSTYAPDRRLSDFAGDISALADHLGMDNFALVGWSGGAHYATVCAALLAKRVNRAVAISGFDLPADTSRMKTADRIGIALTTMPAVGPVLGPWLAKATRSMYLRMARNPDAFWKSTEGRNYLRGQSRDEVDFHIVPSENRDILFRCLVEALRDERDSFRSIVQELSLIKRGWGVDVSGIPPGLLYIWHGTADTYVRVGDAHKKAKAIPGARLRLFENAGHYFWLDHLEELGELLSS